MMANHREQEIRQRATQIEAKLIAWRRESLAAKPKQTA